jgi:hypothetical protein
MKILTSELKDLLILILLAWLIITVSVCFMISEEKEQTIEAQEDATEIWRDNYFALSEIMDFDQQSRQRRIFQWEICSTIEPCWSCVQATTEDGSFGNVESCFQTSCDDLSDGGCTNLLNDLMGQMFENLRPEPEPRQYDGETLNAGYFLNL